MSPIVCERPTKAEDDSVVRSSAPVTDLKARDTELIADVLDSPERVQTTDLYQLIDANYQYLRWICAIILCGAVVGSVLMIRNIVRATHAVTGYTNVDQIATEEFGRTIKVRRTQSFAVIVDFVGCILLTISPIQVRVVGIDPADGSLLLDHVTVYQKLFRRKQTAQPLPARLVGLNLISTEFGTKWINDQLVGQVGVATMLAVEPRSSLSVKKKPSPVTQHVSHGLQTSRPSLSIDSVSSDSSEMWLQYGDNDETILPLLPPHVDGAHLVPSRLVLGLQARLGGDRLWRRLLRQDVSIAAAFAGAAPPAVISTSNPTPGGNDPKVTWICQQVNEATLAAQRNYRGIWMNANDLPSARGIGAMVLSGLRRILTRIRLK